MANGKDWMIRQRDHYSALPAQVVEGFLGRRFYENSTGRAMGAAIERV